MSEASLIHKWHDRHIDAADQVMMSSALTDPQVLDCLLDPAIHQFSHQVPSPSKDPFWAELGQNHYGKLLIVIHKHLITLAMYLQHFLQLPHLIKNQKIYLGLGIKGSTLPDVVKFLATYHLELTPPVLAIDTHFHPEHLLAAYRFSSLEEATTTFPEVLRCVPYFAFPEKWPDHCPLELPPTAAKYQLGWHPTQTKQDHSGTMDCFNHLLSTGSVVTISEVGLDYMRETALSVQCAQHDLL